MKRFSHSLAVCAQLKGPSEICRDEQSVLTNAQCAYAQPFHVETPTDWGGGAPKTEENHVVGSAYRSYSKTYVSLSPVVSGAVYEKSLEMFECVLSGAHRMSQVYQNL